MRIAFINLRPKENENNHPTHIFPPLDIGYAVAILEKEGHETFFIDSIIKNWTVNDLSTFCKENKADIVIIKPSMHTAEETLLLADKIKVENSTQLILLIGAYATYNHEKFLFKESPIDLCILNEAEYVILEICQKLKDASTFEEIQGLAFFKESLIKTSARPLLDDLDSLPLVKQELFVGRDYTFHYPVKINKKIKMGFMLTSRGCPYSCSFCSPIDRASFGRGYHARSPNNVVDEIEKLISLGVNTIYFLDDLFTVDKDRVIGICREVLNRKLDIKWVAQSRVDRLDKEIVHWMKKAGCSTICLGIESGNDRILNFIDKGTSHQKIVESVQLLKNEGILIVGYFIIGNPSETREEVLETIKFAKGLHCDLVQVHFFSPYPGSPSADHFDLQNEHYSKFNTKNNYSMISKEELEALQKKFYRACLLSPSYIARQMFKQGPTIVRNLSSKKSIMGEALRIFS